MIDLTNKKYGRLTVIEETGRKHRGTTWLCKCDCGKEKIINGANLRSGATKSCGCYAIEQRRKSVELPIGQSSFNKLIYEYKHGAEKRGFKWLLTNEDAKILFQKNCHYCGVEPNQFPKGNWAKSYNGLFIYNGIDRKDNKIGYLLENCVSCCTICNRAKHSLSEEDFENWITRITTYKLLARA